MLKKEVADKMTEIITPMKVKRIVDVGSGWGESARFFSELKPEATVFTIDSFGIYGDGRIYNKLEHDVVKGLLSSYNKNVVQVIGNSQKVKLSIDVDIVFIDADHTFDGCLKDFKNYEPDLKEDGLVIFDDYTQENNPTNEVKRVVSEILNKTCHNSTEYKFVLIYEGYYCAILKKIKYA